jgi:hypothetical protein
MTAAVLALIGIVIQGPTIEMSITQAGQEVGKAWLSQKIDAGSKKTFAKLIMGDVKIIETAEYSLDGTPRNKTISRTELDKTVKTEAIFGKAGVSFRSGEYRQQIPLPTKGSTRALSELWFIQTKPKPNQSVEYERFDLYGGAFVHCKVQYVGKEIITVGGVAVSANKVRVDGKTDAWLDDRGDPYRMVIDGKTKFERIGK